MDFCLYRDDYFDELLERIRDIRSSEPVFWRKVLDIYATSIDYDPTEDISIQFFKTVQNKMHWAITGRTAAEIVHERADAAKPNMGLTSWRGAKVRKGDVTIAKNYLDEYERFNRQCIAENDKALSDFDRAAKAIEKRNDKGGKRKEE